MRRPEALACLLLSACAGGADPAADLRIEKVACYEVAGERPAVVAPNAYAGTRPRAVKEFVVVLTTNRPGLVGIGTGSPARAKAVAQKLIGMNPLDFFVIDGGRIAGIRKEHESLVYQLRGMDMAVLDLVGQDLGRPVAELFGPPYRKSVEAYDSSLYFEDLLEGKDLEGYAYAAGRPVERLARKAREAVEKRGHRILKIKVGRSGRLKGDHAGVLADIEAVRAVRDAVGPDVQIFVDGNNGYKGHVDWVMEFARATKDSDVFALEEMFPEEPGAYRELAGALRSAGIPMLIAEGESLNDYLPDWEKSYLESRLVDIVQPDLNNLGILGVRRWAEAAHRHGAKLIAHNFGTKMGVYGAVHAALSVPNTHFVEADDSVFPSIEAPGLEWKGGRYRLTGVPGLGVRISSEALAKAKLHWTVP